ncbi:MAG: HAMP domain-containing sensor histidine kinase [Flavobacteriaceae bacterium]
MILIVSVLGLFIVQYQYLTIGINLAKVQFQKRIGSASKVIKADLATQNQLTFLIEQAIKQDNSYFNTSVDSITDASRHFLNDFITHRLTENGIERDFSYRLYTKNASDYLTAPSTFDFSEKINTYPIELEGYLPLILNKNLILELQFKDVASYFFFQLNGLTIPSLIFMTAIIFVIVWVLRSFYWQRNVITTTNNFINNLTHELKTPVFSIGLATKILKEQASETQKPVLELIQQQTERLKNHIEKVLELGMLESKKHLFELEKVNFTPVLERICEDFKQLSTLETFNFSFHIENKEFLIEAETSHLENAINNLLDNAKKYAKDPIISLNAFQKEKVLTIEIRDNGIGLTKKEQELVFQKYYRVTRGNTHPVQGYGLGLSYVKEIIKKHKATITLESEVGKGTLVKLSLPLTHG